MSRSERFSRRHGLAGKHQGPLVYDDAPKRVRVGFLNLLEHDFDLSPGTMRTVVCRELREEPNPGNWSEYPNIWDEVQTLVSRCEWYAFFDIVEAFSNTVRRHGGNSYEDAVNHLFQEEGIGWQLFEGVLEVRGEEPLEKVLEDAFSQLEAADFEVATQELSEAWQDLSRRPEPDLSGAVTHAMAALEAVAREWSGKPKLTLGDIIKKHADIFPPPLDEALSKLWGYASNEARHGSERRNLELNEAFLLVGVSATLATYLARKTQEAK